MSRIIGVVLLLAAIGFLTWRFATHTSEPVKRAAVEQKDNLGRKTDFVADLASESGNSFFDVYKKSTETKVATKLNFVDWTERSGFAFSHVASRTSEKYLPEVMGAGVILADFNRDGAPDIFAINGGDVMTCPNRPDDIPNRLFLNDGVGNFTDVSAEWNVQGFGFGMGGAAADYDNDGWTDLFLTSWGGGERLYRNVNGTKFEDVTAESGIVSDGQWSTSCGFLDMDRDGDLDLYVARYIDYTRENAIKCFFNTYHTYCAPLLYRGVADRLFRNNGDGTFEDITSSAFPAETLLNAGLGEIQDINACKGLAVGIGDLNNDGWTDIYVANDASRNFLFINQQDGTFDEIGRKSGVAYGENGMEQSGMGAALSDVNNNGRLDVACTNFQSETTNLYSQDDSLSFVDRTDEYGIGQTSRAKLSFGVCFLDADNDGDEDLITANGHIFDNVELFASGIDFKQANSLFESMGDGKFQDVSAVAGDALEDAQVSRGLAVGDIDSDGRVDYLVANNGGTFQFAHNDTPDTGNFVSLWLESDRGNTNAIGTQVVLHIGDKTLNRHVFGASSFLAVNDWRLHIGLGTAESIDRLEIFWPGEETAQIFKNVKANQFLYLRRGGVLQEYQPGKNTIDYESFASTSGNQ
ncbi:MAG: CRTAC1 family protein [Pirellulaceae bacterium]